MINQVKIFKVCSRKQLTDFNEGLNADYISVCLDAS